MAGTLLQRILGKGSHFGEEGDLSVLGNHMSSLTVQSFLTVHSLVGEGKFQKHGCYAVAKLLGKDNQVGRNNVSFKFCSQSFKATFTVPEGVLEKRLLYCCKGYWEKATRLEREGDPMFQEIT